MGTQHQQQAPLAAPVRAPMRGWVRAVFILSVTLNLLVAGVVAGGLIARDRHPMRPPVVSDVSVGAFTQALDPADREALRRAAQAEGQSLRAMRQSAREDHRRLVEALRADPWDEAAVRAVFDAHRDRLVERSAFGGRLLMARITAMTPAQRQAFADRLEQGAERLRGRLKDRRD
ncbi:periplasmic heavy metal sensor [Pontitalea aquivivens]|uniref:periplasmic heavy metal sensor n=1 Tax=Pontitalea aquivivens TaxID=3388663 RepID=UPI003970AF54